MDEYIGIVKPFAGNFAPTGWFMCNGQILPIAQYQALFAIIGTTYGGNGTNSFALPNFQSRTPIGMGRGPGLSSYAEGQLGGTEKVTLNTSNLPAHIHLVIGNVAIKCNSNSANADTPEGSYMAPSSAQIYNDAAAGSTMVPGDVSINLPTTVMGGNVPFSDMNPYLSMNFIICWSGVFPSRP